MNCVVSEGQPNDAGVGEDCAVLYHDAEGKWHDYPCGSSFPFVCERKPGNGHNAR